MLDAIPTRPADSALPSLLFDCSPLMSAGWRWARAQRLATDPRADHTWLADPAIHAAAVFLRNRATGAPDPPGPLADAAAVYTADGPARWHLEALVLARARPRTVARRTGLSPAIVEAYEATFFDVRPRIRAHGWIMARAIRAVPVLGFDPADLAGLWKWVAYFRGVHALDLVRAVTIGVGRDRYTQEQLDDAALFVEVARLRPDKDFERIMQLNAQLRAAAAGRPATSRSSRRAPATDGSGIGTTPPAPAPGTGQAGGDGVGPHPTETGGAGGRQGDRLATAR